MTKTVVNWIFEGEPENLAPRICLPSTGEAFTVRLYGNSMSMLDFNLAKHNPGANHTVIHVRMCDYCLECTCLENRVVERTISLKYQWMS